MTIQQGFAIRRNGSCLAGLETDCGKQAKNFRGCCPTGFVCPEAYNVDCCPSGKNCTTEIVSKPVCANSTWDLYERGGYFCCEPGLPGYDRNDTSICAEPGSTHNGRFLSLVTAGDSATPTSSTNGSSTPVGAIAGGVVGGLAGLALLALVAWFILRRKRQIRGEEPYLLGHNANGNGHGGTYTAHQLDDGQRVNEAGVGKITCTHSEELPAESVPVELPAAQRLV